MSISRSKAPGRSKIISLLSAADPSMRRVGWEIQPTWRSMVNDICPRAPPHHTHVTRVGTAVSVFGLRDPTAGEYNVTLDGETTQFNAQSVWNEGAVLFYMTGLDPERAHSLIITNAEDHLLAVGYINTTTVSGAPMQVPLRCCDTFWDYL